MATETPPLPRKLSPEGKRTARKQTLAAVLVSAHICSSFQNGVEHGRAPGMPRESSLAQRQLQATAASPAHFGECGTFCSMIALSRLSQHPWRPYCSGARRTLVVRSEIAWPSSASDLHDRRPRRRARHDISAHSDESAAYRAIEIYFKPAGNSKNQGQQLPR
jgi:hypothetical protein